MINIMNNRINGKKRIIYLDFIRALAITLVLLAHITRGFFENTNLKYKLFCAPFIDFGVLGVPLFLMISGALLLNKDYKLCNFLKRRYIRVILPFFFWNIMVTISKFKFEGKSLTLYHFLNMYFNNFWFVWMILGIYLFIPVVNSFIKEYKNKGMEYFLVIWLIVNLLYTKGKYPFFLIELRYFEGYLGYFVLGYYISNKKFKLSIFHLLFISSIIFLLFTFININYTLSKCKLKKKLFYYRYKTIIVVLQSIGLYAFVKYFSDICYIKIISISKRIYLFIIVHFSFKIVFCISKFSYGIYLSHYIPLYIFKWFNKNYIPIFTWNPIIWIPIILIILIGISLSILWIFGKIPILRLINGAH